METETLIVLDWPSLIAMRELQEPGEDDIVDELLNTFLDDLAVAVPNLIRAEQAGDLVTMGRIAHRVRGSAASIGAEQLRAAAWGVESTAGAGMRSDASANLQAFLAACDALRAAIAERPAA